MATSNRMRVVTGVTGTPNSLASPGPAGPLYASTRDGWLHSITLSGAVAWRIDTGEPLRRIRLAADGSVWMSAADHRGLRQIHSNGQPGRLIEPAHEPGEFIADFLPLHDGFVIVWLRLSYDSVRVERVDRRGARSWNTSPTITPVGYSGITQRRRDNDWRPEPAPANMPSLMAAEEALILSRDRLLVACLDVLSGLAVAWCLDIDTGDIRWRPETIPAARYAALGNGFLMGASGYDAHETYAYDRDGTLIHRWTGCGQYLVSSRGRVRMVESTRPDDRPPRLRRLHRDGSRTSGPALAPERTVADPVLARDGRAAYWRDGALFTADPQLTVTRVCRAPGRSATGRLLLLTGGVIAAILRDDDDDNAAIHFIDTDLPDIDAGPWPCGQASLSAAPTVDSTRAG